MNHKHIFLFFFLLFCNPVFPQFSKKPLWKDEFRGRKLNTKIWKRSETNSGSQLSIYCDNDTNVYLKGGKLHLKIIKVNDNKKPYRSGRVETKKGYGVGYGKLEIRAKAETCKGIWPALWMRPYPEDKRKIRGEIDIMEYIDCWNNEKIQFNYHIWGDFRGKSNNHVQYQSHGKYNVSDWHVYTYESYPDKFIIKVDGNIEYQVNKGEKGSEWPFGFDYQLLLAYAYGGWGASCGTDDSNMPSEFIIDYVRYYKLLE